MQAVHAFLVFWNWFSTTHSCTVFLPQQAASGAHIIDANPQPFYGGGCTDAFDYARQLHATVVWQGATQGSLTFP